MPAKHRTSKALPYARSEKWKHPFRFPSKALEVQKHSSQLSELLHCELGRKQSATKKKRASSKHFSTEIRLRTRYSDPRRASKKHSLTEDDYQRCTKLRSLITQIKSRQTQVNKWRRSPPTRTCHTSRLCSSSRAPKLNRSAPCHSIKQKKQKGVAHVVM